MKTYQHKLLIIILNVLLFIFSIFLGVSVVIFAGSFFDVQISDSNKFTISRIIEKLPQVESKSIELRQPFKGISNFEVVYQPSLSFEFVETYWFALPSFLIVLYTLGYWLIFFLLRGMVLSVEMGFPFSLANIKRLQLIGYICLSFAVLGLLQYVIQNLFVHFLLKGSDYASGGWVTLGLKLSSGDLVEVLIGLGLLMFARILKTGLEVQRENDLTI